jgi:hypothetical protein
MGHDDLLLHEHTPRATALLIAAAMVRIGQDVHHESTAEGAHLRGLEHRVFSLITAEHDRVSATLDAQGGARLTLSLPAEDQPATVVTDLEYADPNGETLTAATSVAVWPAAIVLGLKPDGSEESQQYIF